MSVTITAPQSRVVPRGITRIAWSSTYPQSAYEILYREVGTTAWQTFGRVTSTTQYVDLDVSRLIDFKEYHFRVVIYSSNATVGTTIYNGSDKSLAYSIIVTPKNKMADMKVRYGDKMVEVPVYSESNAEASTRVSMGDGKIGVCPVVPVDSAAASEHHIEHPIGHRAFADDNPVHYTYSYTPQETYVRQDVRNTHYSYYVASKYDRTYYVGYYISGYAVKYNLTYYRGYYLSGSGARYDRTYYRGYYANGYTTTYGRYVTGTYRDGYYTGTCYDWDQYCYNDYTTYSTGYYSYSQPSGYYYHCIGHTYYLYSGTPGYIEYRCSAGWGSGLAYGWYTVYGSYTKSYSHYWCSSKTYYSYTCTGTKYANTYGYYVYTDIKYDRYYGYYRYYYATYAKYYGYYMYYSPYYSIYYNYYRYYTYYKATYYTYSTSYHYA